MTLLIQALIFVREHEDSNRVLALPEGRLDDIWLSHPQHGKGMTVSNPPASPQGSVED